MSQRQQRQSEKLHSTSVKLPIGLISEIRSVTGFRGISNFIRQAAKERLARLQKSDSSLTTESGASST